jgi:4-nitrophenyl phosphatase
MTTDWGWEQIRALIVDADGTLWRGDTPLPGLVNFFHFLQYRRVEFIIVTNNTVKTPADYRQKLAGFGVQIDLSRIVTAAIATAEYLVRNYSAGDPVFMIGEAGLRQALQDAGFLMLSDASRPAAAVVVGGDSQLTYDKLKNAVLLIQRGAAFIGTNPDLLIPTEEGLVPEAGPTLAAIQAATGVGPTIIGKPEPFLFDSAVTKLGFARAQTAVLGDRLDTDIAGGQRLGLRTILVTTGVDSNAAADPMALPPDAIVSDLADLVEKWQNLQELDYDL